MLLDSSVPLHVWASVCAFKQEVHSWFFFPLLCIFFRNLDCSSLCCCVGGKQIPSRLKDVPHENDLQSLSVIRWQCEWVSVLWKPISAPLGAGDLCHGCLWDDCYDEGASWLHDNVFYHGEATQRGLVPSVKHLYYCESLLKGISPIVQPNINTF